MSDELFALIDARGRAAGASVRAEAAFRAPARARTAAPRPARGWLRPALLVAVAAAVLVGLVLVAKRNDEPAVDHDPSGLRYLVGDLQGNWEAAQLKDAGISTAPGTYQGRLTLYGTAGDPSAPVIQLSWSDPVVESKQFDLELILRITSNRRAFAVGDSAAGCGLLPDESLWCGVELPEGLVQVRARQVPFEDVEVALQTLRITDDSPRVDPASLPSSVTFVTAGDANVVSAAASGNPDSAEVSRVGHLGLQGARMTLVVGWADRQEIAFGAVGNKFQRIPLGDGFAYWAPAAWDTGLAQLLWVRDGRLFSLRADGVEIGSALELAASVRPASNAEWFAKPELVVPSSGGDAVPVTAGADTTAVAPTESGDVDPLSLPPATLAPGAVIVDVPVTQLMGATTPDDADFSVQLPDGTFGTVSIALVGNLVLQRQGEMGTRYLLPTLAGPAVQYLGNDGDSGAYMVTTDASVRQLRVTRSNGERYVMDFVQMPAHPGVFIAAVPLPANTLIHADVIDVAGRVLAATD